MKTAVLLTLLATLAVALAFKKLPPTFRTCGINDPGANECVRAAVEDALKNSLIYGLPDFDIPPLDPLEINELSSKKGKGPVSLDVEFQNIKITGIKEASLYNPKHDDEHTISVEAVIPKLQFDSDYTMDGKALLLPIKGKGRCSFTLTNVTNYLKQVTEPFFQNGVKFIKVVNFEYKFFPQKVHMHFENLFNGDQNLGKTMNKLLNENWELVTAELKPDLQKGLGEVFKDISNKLYTNVPYDEIFPATKL